MKIGNVYKKNYRDEDETTIDPRSHGKGSRYARPKTEPGNLSKKKKSHQEVSRSSEELHTQPQGDREEHSV